MRRPHLTHPLRAALCTFALLASRTPAAAQETAEKAAEKPKPPAATEEWTPPTLGTRFLQTSTPLTNDKGVFEARIQHRFYSPVIDAGGGGAFGLDSSANVTLWMEYTLVKNLAVQVGRATLNADYEFAAKYTALRPTPQRPIAVGVRGGVDWNTAGYADKKSGGFGQLLVSGTIGETVTISAAPSYVQRTPRENGGVFNVPIALQVKITSSIAAIAEYVPKRTFDGARQETKGQWSFGVEKNVYHHKFTLWIGNSGATTVDQLLAGDYNGGVYESNWRIGFNIVRLFDIATD